ncbi:MAG: endonuclease [Acidobacteriota bacterium]|nr:endonuclease [Acidobacteriota bacterium]
MPGEKKSKTTINRYAQIIERIFHAHYAEGSKDVRFTRDELEGVAKELGINLPKNLGDIIYSFRYRVALPDSIRQLAPEGEHWIIRPAGRSAYAFVLTPEYDITPNPNYDRIKVPDATPGLVAKYSLGDEQALLARLRYNRLIDIFTGITCYSLQNHLRTFIAGIGQVETDEVYIGVDQRGVHHVFPVQAKGGKDKLSVVQIEQDFALCASRFASLVPHPIGAQFMADETIGLFEFKMSEEGVKVASEKHYKLVPPDEVTPELLEEYQRSIAAG